VTERRSRAAAKRAEQNWSTLPVEVRMWCIDQARLGLDGATTSVDAVRDRALALGEILTIGSAAAPTDEQQSATPVAGWRADRGL